MTENSKKPSLRFKGFTEAWEQRKLNEIVDYTSSSLTAADRKTDGKFTLYDANNKIGKVDNWKMSCDYITVIKDGAGVGRVRKLVKNTAFIGTMGALSSKNDDLDYIYQMLINEDLSKKFSGSTIPHIYFKDYGQEIYFTPKIKEQQEIGILFSKLDNLITLHQREQ